MAFTTEEADWHWVSAFNQRIVNLEGSHILGEVRRPHGVQNYSAELHLEGIGQVV